MRYFTKPSLTAVALTIACFIGGLSSASASNISKGPSFTVRVQVLKTRVQNGEVKVRLITAAPLTGVLRLHAVIGAKLEPVSPVIAFATQASGTVTNGSYSAAVEIPIGPRVQKLLLQNTVVSGPNVGDGVFSCTTTPCLSNPSKVGLSVGGSDGGSVLLFLWGGKTITPFTQLFGISA